jgi:secondary thiamine-phosphate synthase enzyme
MFEYKLQTKQKQSLVDITAQLEEAVKKSGIKNGIMNVYVTHSTAAIIINENYDPNVCEDIIECLNKLAPSGVWKHDRVDNNADAHIKAAICGPSETIPIKDGKIMLGTWQSPMLACFDGPKTRKLIITIIEE